MKIGITFDYRNKGIKQADRDLKRLGKTSKTTAFAIKKSQLAYTAASAALYKFAKNSVKAILEEEKSIKQLQTTLNSISMGSANSQVEAFIQNLQNVAAVADDQLRPAFSKIVSLIKDVEASQQVLTLATEISVATGKDLTTVVDALTRAYAGQRKGLTSLGVGMDMTFLKTAPLEEVIGALNDKFSGSNQQMLDSYSGRVQRLGVAWGTFKEGAGQGLIDMFDSLFGGFDNGINKFEEFGTTVGDFFRGLGVLWTKVRENPLVKWLTGGIDWNMGGGWIQDIVEMGRTERLARQQRHADDIRENKRLNGVKSKNQIDAAKKVAAAMDKITKPKKPTPSGEGLTPEDKLRMQFDLERISIMAAQRKTADQEAKTRLEALLALNTASYTNEKSNVDELSELLKKLTERQKEYTNAVAQSAAQWKLTVEEANRLTGLYQGATAGSAAQARLADQLASAGIASPSASPATGPTGQGTWTLPPTGGTNVNVTVTGSLLAQQDLEAAIAGAVNNAARAGLSYNQVFSRL